MRLSCAFIVRKKRPLTDGYEHTLFNVTWHLRDVYLSDPIIGRYENVHKWCISPQHAFSGDGLSIDDKRRFVASYSLVVSSRGGFPLSPSSNCHVLMPVKMPRQGVNTTCVFYTYSMLFNIVCIAIYIYIL